MALSIPGIIKELKDLFTSKVATLEETDSSNTAKIESLEKTVGTITSSGAACNGTIKSDRITFPDGTQIWVE